jgi:NADH:ubiquinone oxidoreductase subunit E
MSTAELIEEISPYERAGEDGMQARVVEEIVERRRSRRGAIIPILEEIQSRLGYLPEDALRTVAERTGTSLVDVYGVATFYRAFSLRPRGKHVVCVCLGTACHVRGAPDVEQGFERELGIRPGETTSDRTFSLETVNCLGACALGPVVVADGKYFSSVATSRIGEILERTRMGADQVEITTDQRVFPVKVNCPRCNHTLMDSGHRIDGHASIRLTMSFGHKHGWVRLSSLYGSYHRESEYDVPRNAVPHFFCPHCHTELNGASNCPECEAPMVPMIVRSGGIVQICSRHGCSWHRLDVG